MELLLDLHDHEERSDNNMNRCEFDIESTLDDLQEKVRYLKHIPHEYQNLYFEGRRLGGPGDSSLQSLGLKHRSTVVIKHTLLPQWQSYFKKVQAFRETDEKRLKKELASESHKEAKELDDAEFFTAYPTFFWDWLRMKKEYASFLEYVPTYIKEAVQLFFTRKFSNKLTDIDFKDKPSGIRPGAICTVSFEETQRVFYVKTNINASRMSITHHPTAILNMIELFIYKLLEILGVGAAVQYIPNVVESDKIVLICSEEIIGFKTLTMLEKDWDAFERKTVEKKGEIARSIIQLSLLAQILGMDDLIADNIGFNETDFSLFIVDFHTTLFIDGTVAFEGINRPKSLLSFVNDLKKNLGRFLDFVKEMTFDEQLKIAKECIAQWEISSKLDVAFAKLEEEKEVFNRAGLLFDEGAEILKDYINIVREKISKINSL